MNWYSYWYYTIYSIYKQFSRDSYFAIFATSMFSFFIANIVFSLIAYLSITLNLVDFMRRSSLTMVIPYLSVFILNYIIFLPKKRQLESFEKYKKVQSSVKNAIAIMLSILSVIIFFVVIIQVRKYLGAQ